MPNMYASLPQQPIYSKARMNVFIDISIFNLHIRLSTIYDKHT